MLLMILHVLRMRRNGNRNVFNDRKNVSATTQLPGIGRAAICNGKFADYKVEKLNIEFPSLFPIDFVLILEVLSTS